METLAQAGYTQFAKLVDLALRVEGARATRLHSSRKPAQLGSIHLRDQSHPAQLGSTHLRDRRNLALLSGQAGRNGNRRKPALCTTQFAKPPQQGSTQLAQPGSTPQDNRRDRAQLVGLAERG